MSTDVIVKLKQMAADPGRVWIQGRQGYAGLLDETGRLANTLLSLGLKAGDRLLLQVEKCEAVLSLYLACLRAGVVFRPVISGDPCALVFPKEVIAAPGRMAGAFILTSSPT